MTKQLKKFNHDEQAVMSVRASLQKALYRNNVDEFIPTNEYFPNDYKNNYINDPKDYKKKIKSNSYNRNLVELAKFCYGKYKVPSFLDRCWNEAFILKETANYKRYYYRDNEIDNSLYNWNDQLKFNEEIYPFRSWWICLALGDSLYKKYAKSFLTKKELHTFLNCKYDISLNEALIYSVALCYGASVGNALRIAKTKLNRINLDKDDDKLFWRNVVHFFSMNEADSVNKINDIYDYLNYKIRENPNYSIMGQGFTVKSLEQKMKNWHYDLRRIKEMGDEVWVGDTSISGETYTSKNQYDIDVIWDFRQIKSAKELAKEGNAMHHCVASYKYYCIENICSIWTLKSMTEYGELANHLTIEVRQRKIVQARGFANRSPKPEELKYLRLWANKNGLSISNERFL